MLYLHRKTYLLYLGTTTTGIVPKERELSSAAHSWKGGGGGSRGILGGHRPRVLCARPGARAVDAQVKSFEIDIGNTAYNQPFLDLRAAGQLMSASQCLRLQATGPSSNNIVFTLSTMCVTLSHEVVQPWGACHHRLQRPQQHPGSGAVIHGLFLDPVGGRGRLGLRGQTHPRRKKNP